MRPVLCDAGNTRIRLLELDGNRVVLRSADIRRAAAVFRQLSDDACVFTVAAAGVLRAAGVDGRRVRHVTARDFASGMRCLYDVRRLGADRAANAYAARALCPNAETAVVSVGTCITLDLVRADGVFAGGLILPGVRMSLDAMHSGTAGLPRVALPCGSAGDLRARHPLARTTREAMRRGAIFSLGAAVQRFLNETGARRLVVTGGAARLLAGVQDPGRVVVVPGLALRGLALRLRDTGVLDDAAFQAAANHPALRAPV
jgi:type III pantothenate kinase